MLYGNVGIALLVGWMMVGRRAGLGFSQEGKSYWLLKTAPISPTMLLAAKFLVAYLPALVLGWVFLLAITIVQRAPAAQLLFTLPVVALSTVGNTGLNLSFGVLGARLDWEDPRQMIRGGFGCLSTLSSLVYLPLSMALFFLPALVAGPLEWPQAAGQALGLALGGTLGLVCAFLPLWLVKSRVSRIGEG
jgi:ABC-2 type transport system permease protein